MLTEIPTHPPRAHANTKRQIPVHMNVLQPSPQRYLQNRESYYSWWKLCHLSHSNLHLSIPSQCDYAPSICKRKQYVEERSALDYQRFKGDLSPRIWYKYLCDK